MAVSSPRFSYFFSQRIDNLAEVVERRSYIIHYHSRDLLTRVLLAPMAHE